jgi:arylsulfatase A-like enzyme
MILYPGLERAGERQLRTVSLRDIPATVTEVLGVNGSFPGRSLLATHVDTVLSELHVDWPARGAQDYGWWSMIAGDLHLVLQSNRPGRPGRLFDLRADPDEATDLRAERPEEYDRLMATLRRRVPPYLATERLPDP